MEPRSIAYQSGILTTTLECLLCLCKAIIKPYSFLSDSVQFINFDKNLFISEKLEWYFASQFNLPTQFSIRFENMKNRTQYLSLSLGDQFEWDSVQL